MCWGQCPSPSTARRCWVELFSYQLGGAVDVGNLMSKGSLGCCDNEMVDLEVPSKVGREHIKLTTPGLLGNKLAFSGVCLVECCVI